jgi:hypothetical protein
LAHFGSINREPSNLEYFFIRFKKTAFVQGPKWGSKAVVLPKSYKGLKDVYESMDQETKVYLSKLEPLLSDGKNYEIALAYCFMKLEEGHHRALKCGLVRIHECDSKKVDSELEKQHFTSDKYALVFKNVFSDSIPAQAKDYLSEAQKIRNKIIHGKSTTDPKRREAIYYSLEYMKILGAFVKEKTQKNPYGDLRGLKGKKTLLPAKSTVWMLKGFGLGEKTNQAIA